MSRADGSQVVDIARDYYDSSDADNFYYRIWGGEDIHVGIYRTPDEPILTASRRTVDTMLSRIPALPENGRLLDIGAGYGGSARVIARERGIPVTCLNLSAVQNERNRAMSAEQGLAELIEVHDGNFEELPFDDATFEQVWCQDSILHSGRRRRVFEEVDRVLKPGGGFIFTDPMQKAGVDPELLEPVLARIHLPSMGSVETYMGYAAGLGWETIDIDEKPECLVRHYSRVLEELEKRSDEIGDEISGEYVERMKSGLRHWIEAGSKGALDWGILHFRKPA
ncbi:methyltransferase domain-containing protein [Haloferula sp. A504]|uniref:methyltransferase domain-containing protein n=1 Tax=Haloferula sp. A504 TaxID=3373601 RepID=UPI0031BFD886|nr:methyltransferase domain-containing protein [Verrucomicrobiaceae bacterium E54]